MRRQPSLTLGAGLGALTGFCVIALSYLGQQWAGFPFFPFVLFDWLARVLPGGVITLGIDTMVRIIVGLGLGPIDVVAKGMEQLLGIVLWIVISAVVGVVISWWLRQGRGNGQGVGAIAGAMLGLLVLIALIGLRALGTTSDWALLWLAILVPGWGAALGTALEHLEAVAPGQAPIGQHSAGEPGQMSRRDFLLRVGGGSILLALIAGGLGRLLATGQTRTGAGQPLSELKVEAAAPATVTAPQAGAPVAPTSPAVSPTPDTRIPAAPGTRPEVTSNADFYRIDINLRPPEIAGSSWQLQVAGLFDRPRNLGLNDLVAMPAVSQPITQSCISNPIGGDLISTAYYTGVRFRDVLQELGLRPEAKEIALKSADGFYESVEMADIMDPRVLLVYGMNGQTLPIEHGYPLRIYIPNRYGMKQPKWITNMEAIDHKGRGYWVDRGWSAEARPQVISIIDTVATDHIENGRLPVGGIAWAGDRGIRSVQVQVDDGPWAEAALRTPSIGPLTWVQWRYDWPVAQGRHTFRVRAVDGKGTQQIGEMSDTYPNGATGYHSVTVTI